MRNEYNKSRLLALYEELNEKYKAILIDQAEFYLDYQRKESGNETTVIDIRDKLNASKTPK